MRCKKCGKDVVPQLCGKCRAEIKHLTVDKSDLIPLLYYDAKAKGYRAGCTVLYCPCNDFGVCKVLMIFEDLVKLILHPFDNDNIIHQSCG